MLQTSREICETRPEFRWRPMVQGWKLFGRLKAALARQERERWNGAQRVRLASFHEQRGELSSGKRWTVAPVEAAFVAFVAFVAVLAVAAVAAIVAIPASEGSASQVRRHLSPRHPRPFLPLCYQSATTP